MIAAGVVRLDLLQSTVVEIFEAELGIRVIWGRSNLPRLPRPFIRCQLISGPTRPQLSHEHREMVTESQYSVVFPAPSEGDVLKMRGNGVPFARTSPADDTADAARDYFVTQINLDREPATAAAGGAGELVLTESRPGSLWSVGASLGVTVEPTVDSVQACIDLLHCRSDVTFSMQIIGGDARTGTAGSAADIAAQAIMVLDLDRTIDRLSDMRLVLADIAGPTDITGFDVTQAQHESRQSIDFRAVVTTSYPQLIDVIEEVEGIIDTGASIPLEVATP